METGREHFLPIAKGITPSSGNFRIRGNFSMPGAGEVKDVAIIGYKDPIEDNRDDGSGKIKLYAVFPGGCPFSNNSSNDEVYLYMQKDEFGSYYLSYEVFIASEGKRKTTDTFMIELEGFKFGDDFVMNFKLKDQGELEDVITFPDTMLNEDTFIGFFAVYDHQALWRANLYIEEGKDIYDGSPTDITDWNNIDSNRLPADEWSTTSSKGGQIEIMRWTSFWDNRSIYGRVCYGWGCCDSPHDFNSNMEDQSKSLCAFDFHCNNSLAPFDDEGNRSWIKYLTGTNTSLNAYTHLEKTYVHPPYHATYANIKSDRTSEYIINEEQKNDCSSYAYMVYNNAYTVIVDSNATKLTATLEGTCESSCDEYCLPCTGGCTICNTDCDVDLYIYRCVDGYLFMETYSAFQYTPYESCSLYYPLPATYKIVVDYYSGCANCTLNISVEYPDTTLKYYPYRPGFASAQKFGEQGDLFPNQEIDNNWTWGATVYTAGVDCAGFIQRVVTYTGNPYSSDLSTDVVTTRQLWNDTGVREAGYWGDFSLSSVTLDPTISRNALVPGDILTGPKHVMMVQSIDFPANTRVIDKSQINFIRVIHSTPWNWPNDWWTQKNTWNELEGDITNPNYILVYTPYRLIIQ